LSIRPERIEASHERKNPYFPVKNSGRKDYNQGKQGTQGGNRKKGRKNAVFLGACAKRAGFMRVGRVRGKGKWVKGRVLCFLIPKWTRRTRHEHGNKLESARREDNADREAGATRRSGELSGQRNGGCKEIRRDGAFGMQLLEAGGGGKDVLHRAGESF
jgi:hypothetical protein